MSRYYIRNMSSQCMASSMALQREKSKSLLIPGPRVAWVINGWCIVKLMANSIDPDQIAP